MKIRPAFKSFVPPAVNIIIQSYIAVKKKIALISLKTDYFFCLLQTLVIHVFHFVQVSVIDQTL